MPGCLKAAMVCMPWRCGESLGVRGQVGRGRMVALPASPPAHTLKRDWAGWVGEGHVLPFLCPVPWRALEPRRSGPQVSRCDDSSHEALHVARHQNLHDCPLEIENTEGDVAFSVSFDAISIGQAKPASAVSDRLEHAPYPRRTFPAGRRGSCRASPVPTVRHA